MSARFDPAINGAPPPIIVSGPPNDPIASNGGRDSPDESHGAQRADSVRMPVLMAGTLQKMGRRLKRWTPRYFELQGSKLHYYKTPSKQEYLGAIDLKLCYSATLSSIVSFGSTFELRTLYRTHILAARTREDRERWLSSINEKIMPSKEVAEEKRKTIEIAPPKKGLSFRKRTEPPDHVAKAQVIRKESLMERFFTPKSRRKHSTDATEDHPMSSLNHTRTNELHSLSVSTPASPVSKRLSMERAIFAGEVSPEPWSPSSTLERSTGSPIPASTPMPTSPAAVSSVATPMDFPASISLPPSPAVNELRELLNSLPESNGQLSYDGWPPLSDEGTWMGQPTAIEQLRQFLVSCP